MVKASVTVNCPQGLHIHPATILCNEAIRFASTIQIQCNGVTRDGKSLLGVLGARVNNGSEITFICEGPDEEEALKALVEVVSTGLMRDHYDNV